MKSQRRWRDRAKLDGLCDLLVTSAILGQHDDLLDKNNFTSGSTSRGMSSPEGTYRSSPDLKSNGNVGLPTASGTLTNPLLSIANGKRIANFSFAGRVENVTVVVCQTVGHVYEGLYTQPLPVRETPEHNYRIFLNHSEKPNVIFTDQRVANDYAIHSGEARIDKFEVTQTKDFALLWEDPFLPSEEILLTRSSNHGG